MPAAWMIRMIPSGLDDSLREGNVDKHEILQYWIESSDTDFSAMEHLFEKADYAWALFVGHLVLEKLIKAWYVHNVGINPPFIHDLVRLAEKADLALSEGQKDILDTVSTFNLRACYDDYKREFHRKCTRDFTKKWMDEIRGMRTWLREKLPKP
jgi:HEPN domain-containing protein